jgi:hypothetical protein
MTGRWSTAPGHIPADGRSQAIRDLLGSPDEARSFADGARNVSNGGARLSQRRRLEWILRIQPERDASQLLRDTVDVPVYVQGHSLKIAIAALEVGALA